MLNKRMTRVVTSVAALAFLLSAQAAAAQTLRLWTFLDPNGKSGREVALKQLIEGFEASHPGTTISVEPQIWQQMADKFLAADQTGTAPDLIWTVLPRIAGEIEAGALANLDELYMKDWSPEELADVDGPFYQFLSKPGEHYTVIGSRQVFGNCYRADLLEKAGIKVDDLKSWDAFIKAAQKLQETDANGNVSVWGYGQTFASNGGDSAIIGMGTVLQLNGKAFDDDGKPLWANEAGVKAVQLGVDMVEKYKITSPDSVSMSQDDVYDQFSAGRAVFARCASAKVPQMIKALGDKGTVGFMQTPSFVPDKWSLMEVSGWAMSVWSKSPNKELAGEVVEFMSDKAADEIWLKVAGQVPMRKSTFDNNKDFFADPQNAYLVDVAQTLSESSWFPAGNVAAGKNDFFQAAIQDAITNKTPPMEALEKAEQAYIRANRL
jgi:multiple sugar transport system substrate-binding protein